MDVAALLLFFRLFSAGFDRRGPRPQRGLCSARSGHSVQSNLVEVGVTVRNRKGEAVGG